MPTVRRFEPECVELTPEFGAKELTSYDAEAANDNDGDEVRNAMSPPTRTAARPALAFACALAVALALVGLNQVLGVV